MDWSAVPLADFLGQPAWLWLAFLGLALEEVADLIFAADSVPAIVTITSAPYIVDTRNIVAVLAGGIVMSLLLTRPATAAKRHG